MIEDNNYETTVLNAKAYRIFYFTYLFGGMALSAFLTWYLHQITILWGGVILFCVCPILLKKQFRFRFTQSAIILFGKDKMIIELYDIKNDILEEHIEHNYDEIKSYRILEENNESYLRLYFKTGDKKSYNFEEHKSENKGSIVYAFAKQVRWYNEHNQEGNKIALKPSFYTTKVAWYILIVLGIGYAVLFMYLINHLPKAIPFSVIGGIILFLSILVQRRRDIKQYQEEK